MRIFRRLAISLSIASLALSLSACAATVVLDAAPDANNPACAEVTVRLPDSVGELSKRVTNAQATGAWGNPTAVILRCGLPAVEVSQLTCVTAGGVDWLVDESNAPKYRFISFGRKPATEVIVDSEITSGVSALEAVGPAVANIPATKNCTG
jgi:hypothetical protein